MTTTKVVLHLVSPASGDLVEAAANLFSQLRDLDEMARELGLSRIAVAPIPSVGLGLAINDRLRRAAAPRPWNRQETFASPCAAKSRVSAC